MYVGMYPVSTRLLSIPSSDFSQEILQDLSDTLKIYQEYKTKLLPMMMSSVILSHGNPDFPPLFETLYSSFFSSLFPVCFHAFEIFLLNVSYVYESRLILGHNQTKVLLSAHLELQLWLCLLSF